MASLSDAGRDLSDLAFTRATNSAGSGIRVNSNSPMRNSDFSPRPAPRSKATLKRSVSTSGNGVRKSRS